MLLKQVLMNNKENRNLVAPLAPLTDRAPGVKPFKRQERKDKKFKDKKSSIASIQIDVNPESNFR